MILLHVSEGGRFALRVENHKCNMFPHIQMALLLLLHRLPPSISFACFENHGFVCLYFTAVKIHSCGWNNIHRMNFKRCKEKSKNNMDYLDIFYSIHLLYWNNFVPYPAVKSDKLTLHAFCILFDQHFHLTTNYLIRNFYNAQYKRRKECAYIISMEIYAESESRPIKNSIEREKKEIQWR